VVGAAVISRLIQQLPFRSSVPCDYISGAASSSSGKKQQKILEDFSDGRVGFYISFM